MTSPEFTIIGTRPADDAHADDSDALEDQHMKALARVPTADMFNGDQYLKAPELETIAERLIDEHSLDAQYFAVEILWQKKLGTSRGQPVWGKTQMISGLTKFYAGKVDFVICMAANHALDYRITNYQLEAALFEELLRIRAEVDDDGITKPTMAEPDLDGFSRGIMAYGEWKPAYKTMRTALKQARLIPDGFLN